MLAELPVEELDLPDLHLVQVDLHLARQLEGVAEERDRIDLRAANAGRQLCQLVDMLDQLIQSFLVAHKSIVRRMMCNYKECPSEPCLWADKSRHSPHPGHFSRFAELRVKGKRGANTGYAYFCVVKTYEKCANSRFY